MFESPQMHISWREAWAAREKALRSRMVKTCERLEQNSRELLPLREGDMVFIQNQDPASGNPNKWDREGTIIQTGENDQYLVRVHGTWRVTLRNRRLLRKFSLRSPKIGSEDAPLGDVRSAADAILPNLNFGIPAAEVDNQGRPPSAVDNQGRSPAAIDKQRRPRSAVAKQLLPPTAINNQRRPPTAIDNQCRPPSVANSQRDTPTAIDNQRSPHSASPTAIDKHCPPTVSGPTALHNEQHSSDGIPQLAMEPSVVPESVVSVPSGSSHALVETRQSHQLPVVLKSPAGRAHHPATRFSARAQVQRRVYDASTGEYVAPTK
jgi:hypothetical protein